MFLFILSILLYSPPYRNLIIRGTANNGRIATSCPFPALLTPLPVIAVFNEEAIGCINE